LHDEELESLASDYDRTALAQATSATYVVHQDVAYCYERPVSRLRQRLVVVPRARHGDQRRIAHRFEVCSDDAAVTRTRTDRYGNTVLHVDAPAVHNSIEFRARAVITRTRRPSGRPAWTSAGPTATFLTTPDRAIDQTAAALRDAAGAVETAEQICEFVHRSFQYRHDVTSVRTTASEAWQLRQGVCQDMAHVMIAMCTSLGVPARYVSGHLVGDGASHAWVEVYDAARHCVSAFDPTHDRRTDLRYVTTATGRDYRDVAPTSGTFSCDGGYGHLTVRKKIRLAELA
jgi:transglutaminase-like putative cysteine protease